MCAAKLFAIDISVLNHKTNIECIHQENQIELKPTIHKNLETITTLKERTNHSSHFTSPHLTSAFHTHARTHARTHTHTSVVVAQTPTVSWVDNTSLITDGHAHSPPAYVLAQCRAVFLNISGSSLYCLATTASCGSSGSAADSNACNDSSTVRNVIAAALVHSQSLVQLYCQMVPLVPLSTYYKYMVHNGTHESLPLPKWLLGWFSHFCTTHGRDQHTQKSLLNL